MPLKVVSVVGNRPQFIKAAPLQAALDGVCDHVLVHTGQHYDRELSQVFFDELGLRPPDHEIAAGSGGHSEQTAAMLAGLDPVLAGERPDLVLVVRRHQLDPGGRAGRVEGALPHSATSSRGCARSTATCPRRSTG